MEQPAVNEQFNIITEKNALNITKALALSKPRGREWWNKIREPDRNLFEKEFCLSPEEFWDVYLLSYPKLDQLHEDDSPKYKGKLHELGTKHLNVGVRALIGDVVHADTLADFYGGGWKIPAKDLALPKRASEHKQLHQFLKSTEVEMVRSSLMGSRFDPDYQKILKTLETIIEIEGRPNNYQQTTINALKRIFDVVREQDYGKIPSVCSLMHQAIHTGGGALIRMLLKPDEYGKFVDMLIKQSASGDCPIRFAFEGASNEARKLFTRWATVYSHDVLEKAQHEYSNKEIADILMKSLVEGNIAKIRDVPLLKSLLKENRSNDELIVLLLDRFGVKNYLSETEIPEDEIDQANRVYTAKMTPNGEVYEEYSYQGRVMPGSTEETNLKRYELQPGVKYKLKVEPPRPI